MDPSEPLVSAEDDIGLLCMVIANGFNDAVLERLAEKGFGDAKFGYGFIVQGLLAGDRTATELAQRLDVSVQAVSKTVHEMESLGYLESTRDPADGRARKLALSARGLANLAEARHARLEVMQRLQRTLGLEKTDDVLVSLRMLAAEFGGMEAMAQRRLRPM